MRPSPTIPSSMMSPFEWCLAVAGRPIAKRTARSVGVCTQQDQAGEVLGDDLLNKRVEAVFLAYDRDRSSGFGDNRTGQQFVRSAFQARSQSPAYQVP